MRSAREIAGKSYVNAIVIHDFIRAGQEEALTDAISLLEKQAAMLGESTSNKPISYYLNKVAAQLRGRRDAIA